MTWLSSGSARKTGANLPSPQSLLSLVPTEPELQGPNHISVSCFPYFQPSGGFISHFALAHFASSSSIFAGRAVFPAFLCVTNIYTMHDSKKIIFDLPHISVQT